MPSCGLDMCFHQTPHLEVRDSQFNDLPFKSFDHCYCIIFYAEHNMLFAETLLLASVKLFPNGLNIDLETDSLSKTDLYHLLFLQSYT